MEISVRDGIANIDPSIYSHLLVGATCPTSLRVGAEPTKSSFRILPEKDSKGDLVLVSMLFTDEPKMVLYHVKRRDNGIVTVKNDPKDVNDMVNPGANYQVHKRHIELVVGRTLFTSNEKMHGTADENVQVTDTSSILKFIAGKIKIGELRATARRAKRALTTREALDKCRRDLDAANRDIALKDRKISKIQSDFANLTTQLSAIQPKA